MKKILVLVGVFLLLLGTDSLVSATVLTFDDLAPTTSYSSIYDGYGGFSWGIGDRYMNESLIQNTGYEYGVVSGNYAAFNASGYDFSISGAMFNFDGAYLTAAWNNGLNIEFKGFYNSSLLYQQTVQVNYNQATWFDFNYIGIDTLLISSSGGTWAAPGAPGDNSGTNFVMDDFTFNSSPVPEPATMLLLGTGLIGLVGFGRKKFVKKYY